MKLKEQRIYGIILTSIGAIIWIIAMDAHQGEYLSALGSMLALIGILKIIKSSRLLKDPEKSANYENAINDERIKYISNKARSLTFVLSIYIQLIGALIIKFAFGNNQAGNIICYFTASQAFLYFMLYKIFEKKY